MASPYSSNIDTGGSAYSSNNLYADLLNGHNSSFFMPLNTSVFGNFSFNGGWENGGMSIIDGDAYVQTLFAINLTSLNVVQQNLTVTNNFLVDGNITADNFIGTHFGNSSIWSRAGTNTFLTNLGDNVGIGQTVPAQRLHVNSGGTNSVARFESTDATAQLELKDSVDTGYFGQNSAITFMGFSAGQNAQNLNINVAGNVGIGIIDAQRRFHIDGGGTQEFLMRLSKQSGISQSFDLKSDGSKLTLQDGGADQLMTWDAPNERVGIGTTTPDVKFQVNGSARFGEVSGGTYNGNMDMNTGTDRFPLISFRGGSTQKAQIIVDANTGTFTIDTLNDFVIRDAINGGNITFKIEHDNGFVGIGTTSPGAKLEVNGSVIIQDDLDMTNGSIISLWELVSTDGSRIATGTNPAYSMFSGLDSAEIFSNNQTVGSGVITHALLSTDPGNEKVLAAWQSGRNNSGQYTRNSAGFFPDLGSTNLSILTNVREMWLNFGINPLAEYFSAQNKTSVAALWAFESQKLFLHDDIGNGQLLGVGEFTWIARDGTSINLFNGDGVHIKKEVIKEFGFDVGDSITALDANFDSSTLLPFVQITGGGLLDWAETTDVLCHSPECARALGGSGSPLRTMQTNFSTLNQDNLNLSWWTTTSQASPDAFTVEVNNNVGSGDVEVFSSSDILVDEYQSLILPSSMDNKSTITINFNFQGNNPSQDIVYVDEVLVVGNATVSTLANVTVEDGTLNFGNKECNIIQSAEDGYQDLNITCDNINLIGNVTAVDVTEVSINVTTNINAQGNITAGDRLAWGGVNGGYITANATCWELKYKYDGTLMESNCE